MAHKSEDHYVYLSSNASLDVYPNNKNNSFMNRVLPIRLDNGTAYECGVCEVLMPSNRLGVLSHEVEFGLTIDYEDNQGKVTKLFEYTPSVSCKSDDDIDYIVKKLTQDIAAQYAEKVEARIWHEIGEDLYASMDDLRKKLIPFDFLQVDNERGLVFFTCNEVYDSFKEIEGRSYPRVQRSVALQDLPPWQITNRNIGITFHVGLARILGMKPNTRYLIKDNLDSNKRKIYAPYYPQPMGGSGFIFIYSDIVQLSRFGSQLTSIIDTRTIYGKKSNANVTYFPLKPLSEINSIGISIYDQDGIPVRFIDGSDVIVLLHIRPKHKGIKW